MAKTNPYTYLKAKYKIFSTQKFNAIQRTYPTPKAFEEKFAEQPYWTAICYLNKTFSAADELILNMFPHLRVSTMRCLWYINHLLKQNESYGDTCIEAKYIYDKIQDEAPELANIVFDVITTNNMFHYEPRTRVVALRNTYEAECLIAQNIKERVHHPVPTSMKWEDYTIMDGMDLTDEQTQVLKLACDKSVFMVNGVGGSGKTSSVQALVKMIENNGYSITLLAPTGIAAKRLREVTGHSASTIHKHLYTGGSFGDFLLIDESSMLGVHLLALLLGEVPKKTKIIFICDEAQLASISCGNIVKDIIDSGAMPIVHLTKVFRFGIGGIATATTNIRTGAGLRDMKPFDDYTFIPIDSKKPMEQILDNYEAMLSKYGKDEVIILSPFNVRELGTYTINKAIQDRYNNNPVVFEYKRQGYTITFREGSMCLNTENNYDVASDIENFAIMNGEKGTMIGANGNTFTCSFDNGVAQLEKGDMYKMLLGEAMSIHKSQGNQTKAVIVVLDKSHDFALSRNIIYVAASRAQKELIIIGDMDTIDHALTIQQEEQRQTYLKELLQ